MDRSFRTELSVSADDRALIASDFVGFRVSVFELWFYSGRVGSRVGCHGAFKPQFYEPDVATGCILDDGLHRLAE